MYGRSLFFAILFMLLTYLVPMRLVAMEFSGDMMITGKDGAERTYKVFFRMTSVASTWTI